MERPTRARRSAPAAVAGAFASRRSFIRNEDTGASWPGRGPRRLEQSAAGAAVHRYQRAGDVAGGVGGEEGDHSGDLLRVAEAAGRDLCQVGVGRARLVELLEALGGDPAGRDRVDGDRLGAQLTRERLGPADQAGANGVREGEVLDRLAHGDGGDVDDPSGLTGP